MSLRTKTRMSTLRKETEKKGKAAKKDEKRTDAEGSDVEEMAAVLAELRDLRREHSEASQDTKATLSRVESTIDDVLSRTTRLEQQVTNVEQRVSDTEDKTLRHERAIRYLLQREVRLSAKCEDLESRARRNNLRIYGVKEGEEMNDMIKFISNLMRTSLELPDDLDLCVERAHRSLTMKPKEPAPPRSIIVRFSDYRVKDKILQQAWKKRGVTHQGQKIFFDQDYTSDVQKKRKQVREVIKQLKEKKVKAQSPFPAQLKIHLDSGVKTFTTLSEAAPTLKKMGINIKVDEREDLQKELLHNPVATASASNRAGLSTMTNADLQAFVRGDD